MKRILPLLATILVVVSSGVAHGIWANRWIPSHAIETAVASLHDIPKVIGDWEGKDQELDQAQIEVGEISGYVSRRFTNRRNGTVASILLVCGRPGPIAVHTPAICYSGSGFELQDAPTHFHVKANSPLRQSEFEVDEFVKNAVPVPLRLRVYWSLKGMGTWAMPKNPRIAFARAGSLYKLYVLHDSVSSLDPTGSDPGAALLRDLLPVLDRVLAR